MKLAISNIAWDSKDNEKVYTLMEEYGFTGLEIAPTKFFPQNPYDHLDMLKNLKEYFLNKNIQLVSMQSILFGKGELTLFESLEKREELKEYLGKAIVFANRLGIKNIVFGNPKNRISYSSEDFQIGVEFFKELGEFAFQNSVNIGIEANPEIYGGNFLTTTEEAIQFIREIDSKGVGLNFDLGTIIEKRESLDILYSIKDKITHVHISEPYLETISEKNVSYHKELISILREIDYQNFISIEMKSEDGEQNIQRVEKCLKYLSELMKGEK